MKDLIGPASTTGDFEFVGGNGIDMPAWKSTYTNAAKDDALMAKFWSVFDPKSSSMWTMVYDEAEYNENLEDTIELVKDFLNKCEPIKDHCFGVMHILDGLQIEGLWIFNGENPEQLFGANEDTSWYTWNQIGPEPNDLVKKAVAGFMTPADGQLNGKAIKNTQAFCS